MKFNLDAIIAESKEYYPHGVTTYDEVGLTCNRTTGEVFIKQIKSYLDYEHYDVVVLNEDQALELYHHLKQVFGE